VIGPSKWPGPPQIIENLPVSFWTSTAISSFDNRASTTVSPFDGPNHRIVPISLLPGRTAHSECGRMGGRPQTWRLPFPDVSLLTSLQRGIRWPQLQDCSCSHGQRRCEAKGRREDLLLSRAESQTRGHTDRPDSHAAWTLIIVFRE
jgi:hypothetical protein